jgi:hypothetical protein
MHVNTYAYIYSIIMHAHIHIHTYISTYRTAVASTSGGVKKSSLFRWGSIVPEDFVPLVQKKSVKKSSLAVSVGFYSTRGFCTRG